MDPNVDIHKFAEKLVKAGREAVAWEHKKLEWVLERERQDAGKSKAA